MKRGDVYLVELGGGKGSEQAGLRPMVIIQNDIGNKYSPTIIVAAITSQISKKRMPTHVEISGLETGLIKDSVVLGEQIRTIDKSRLGKHITTLSKYKMREIDNAIAISLGLTMRELVAN